MINASSALSVRGAKIVIFALSAETVCHLMIAIIVNIALIVSIALIQGTVQIASGAGMSLILKNAFFAGTVISAKVAWIAETVLSAPTVSTARVVTIVETVMDPLS